MAIYHLSIKIISRGKGKSAVAAAAYRSGEKITNEYDGVIHDYTKKGGITHTEILLPDHAPKEYKDCQSGSLRSTLWNAVEKVENAKNSQLAREIELALPKELTQEQNISLVHDYVNKHFVSVGMCADICIHDKNDGNPHAHIMLTMRPLEQDGNWGAKSKKEYILDENGEKIVLKSGEFKSRKISTTDWNEQTKAEEWRSAWATSVNSALEQNNHAVRIDHRSYERRGIDQIPSLHLGVAASQMEKRGIQTERGNINREINFSNQQLKQLKARIGKLQKWLKEESTSNNAPTLFSVVQDILQNNDSDSNYAKIHNLKIAAKTLVFLQQNNIYSLPELREKVLEFYGRQQDMRDKFKPIEWRLKTLGEHIHQADIYHKYKGKAQSETEEVIFSAAKKYISDNLNGRNKIPYKSWTDEHKRLLAERDILNQQYTVLKEDVREVEIIRKYAEDIQRTIDRPQRIKTNNIEI